MTFEVLMVVNI